MISKKDGKTAVRSHVEEMMPLSIFVWKQPYDQVIDTALDAVSDEVWRSLWDMSDSPITTIGDTISEELYEIR